jgi:membrane protein implicated in regulation of membrane protease activity
MRRYKRIAALLVGGFFAFAPPGTLIFLALLAASLFGRWWVAAACAASLVAALAWLVFRKRLRTKPAPPEKTSQS